MFLFVWSFVCMFVRSFDRWYVGSLVLSFVCSFVCSFCFLFFVPSFLFVQGIGAWSPISPCFKQHLQLCAFIIFNCVRIEHYSKAHVSTIRPTRRSAPPTITRTSATLETNRTCCRRWWTSVHYRCTWTLVRAPSTCTNQGSTRTSSAAIEWTTRYCS